MPSNHVSPVESFLDRMSDAVAVEIAYSNHGVVGVGATELPPGVESAVADCFDPDVACRAVPKQDVRYPVTIEIAHTNNTVVGVGAADLVPTDGPLQRC